MNTPRTLQDITTAADGDVLARLEKLRPALEARAETLRTELATVEQDISDIDRVRDMATRLLDLTPHTPATVIPAPRTEHQPPAPDPERVLVAADPEPEPEKATDRLSKRDRIKAILDGSAEPMTVKQVTEAFGHINPTKSQVESVRPLLISLYTKGEAIRPGRGLYAHP